MLHRYKDYTSELLLENLILESKLEFSKKFLGLLGSMPQSKIKDELLKLHKDKTDLNLVQNYIDLSDNKEEITFVADRRAQQILGQEGEIKWKANSNVSSRYLTFNKTSTGKYTNRAIFNALGFDPTGGESDHPVPPSGAIGVIKAETVSETSGKTYCLFEWGEGKTIVLNKVALDPHDDRYNRIWQQTRNPIRIGRFISSVLNAAKISVTDREKEEFVNHYKSAFDILNDAFLKFDVVEGDDIAHWYNIENYESEASTLGNSCMASVKDSFFKIYTKNPKVCKLVILYGEEGKVNDKGQFKGKKIRGRALLWKTDQGDYFMDRIYYNKDSDVELFKQYAEKNDWWCKQWQNSDCDFTAVKGSSTKSPEYSVTLDESDFKNYPYVDTLTYLNKKKCKISNNIDLIEAKWEMDDTEGGSYKL